MTLYKFNMTLFLRSVLTAFVVMVFVTMITAEDWTDARATFYGDKHGNETEFGACGYDCFHQGYGLQTTALSTALFDGGKKCGACFEIKCVNSSGWCINDAPIEVTATNHCPPSPDPTAWCNPPQKHFDLSQPMFLKIAQYRAGVVPVKYRRVPCVRQGGIKFKLGGHQWFLLVLVFNVGGVGDVTSVKIKGSNSTNWVPMSRNWGDNWQANVDYIGQGLCFHVTVSDGKHLQFDKLVPSHWKFNQTYEGKSNF